MEGGRKSSSGAEKEGNSWTVESLCAQLCWGDEELFPFCVNSSGHVRQLKSLGNPHWPVCKANGNPHN